MFRYFAIGEFAKFKLCLLLDFLESLNHSFIIKIHKLKSANIYMTNLNQVAKLNSMYIFIL